MNLNIEDISDESSCDHCGGDIHGEPPFCEEDTGLIFCSRECFIKGRDSKDFWTFDGDKSLVRITFIKKELTGRYAGDDHFEGEDGDAFSKHPCFLEGLDPEVPEEFSYNGDPGELGYWWIDVPFSTREKALEARSFAIEEAIEGLKLRIEASKMQINEDLQEIKELENLRRLEE